MAGLVAGLVAGFLARVVHGSSSARGSFGRCDRSNHSAILAAVTREKLSFRDGALAPDPESRDSGFDASHRPGMTGPALIKPERGARRSAPRLRGARPPPPAGSRRVAAAGPNRPRRSARNPW